MHHHHGVDFRHDPPEAPGPGVRVLGAGVLHETVATALARTASVADTDVMVVDAWSPELAVAARTAYREGRGFLPVHPTPRGVRIGPFTAAGASGCQLCVQVREYRARTTGPAHAAALWRGIYQGTVRLPRPVLSPPVRDVVAALVADEIAGAGRCAGAVLELTTGSLAVSRHRFLAEPGCPVCGVLPDDGPEAAALTFTSSAKRSRHDFRARRLDEDHERLLAAMVDPVTGLLCSVTVHHKHPMVVVTATGGPVGDGELTGYGRTFTERGSVSVAVAEALERLGGSVPRARRTAVRASFAELGPERAVDPTVLGLPAGPPDERSVAYHPDLPLDWVHGYSFRRGGPVLVPETFVYYESRGTGFGPENSNGCAVGAGPVEAVLHGIFEVAERDAFLTTWYARRPVPRIDPMTSADPTNRLLVRWLERTTGSRVHVFDITMPERLPALWVMLVDEQERPGHPRAFCVAGAHLDPERALRSGLVELASVAEAIWGIVAADTTAASLVADPDLVCTMDDHMLSASCPAGWDRFAFLYGSEAVHGMPQAGYRPAADLLDDLRHTVGRYLDRDLDVVVVDQTAREQQAVGLHSVKVLIPGLLPMSFGHRNRRVDLPRLREFAPAGINPYPHPFP